MKTVTGRVISAEPISLSKAATILSGFVSSETETSQDVNAYLRRASAAFTELRSFHREIRSTKPKSEARHERNLTDEFEELGRAKGIDDSVVNAEKNRFRESETVTGEESVHGRDQEEVKEENKKKKKKSKENKEDVVEEKLEDKERKKKRKKNNVIDEKVDVKLEEEQWNEERKESKNEKKKKSKKNKEEDLIDEKVNVKVEEEQRSEETKEKKKEKKKRKSDGEIGSEERKSKKKRRSTEIEG